MGPGAIHNFGPRGQTEIISGPWANAAFATIWALFNLAKKSRPLSGGPLKWWTPDAMGPLSDDPPKVVGPQKWWAPEYFPIIPSMCLGLHKFNETLAPRAKDPMFS